MKKILLASVGFLLLSACKTLDTEKTYDRSHDHYAYEQAEWNREYQAENQWLRRDAEARRRINELEQRLRNARNENQRRQLQAQINQQHQEEIRARQQVEETRRLLRAQELGNQQRQAQLQAQQREFEQRERQRLEDAQQREEMRQARNARFVPPASIGPDTASQRAQEDALRAQEERDLQEAIHNSRITAQEEQRLREEERQREQRQHQALMPQPEPAAPEPQQPAPEADQGIARNVDERSWYEAGEIVKEYRNANGGRPPSVAHVVAQLQARLGITAVQAQTVCDEMGLF